MNVGALFDKSRSIAIIGMPGSGKTTVGRELARITSRRFFDTDIIALKRTGKSPRRLIEEYGESYFRDVESECLVIAVANAGSVISTGGGIVTRTENRAPLKENCFVILITRPLDALYIKNRPLSLQNGVYKLYEERAHIYADWADATFANESSYETARLIRDTYLQLST